MIPKKISSSAIIYNEKGERRSPKLLPRTFLIQIKMVDLSAYSDFERTRIMNSRATRSPSEGIGNFIERGNVRLNISLVREWNYEFASLV